MSEVIKAKESLAQALTDTCIRALKEVGFTPSEILTEKIYEEIHSAITIKS